nr:phage GP46 family protein [Aliamphritea spongicola]
MKQTTMPALGWHSTKQQLDLKPAPADQLSWLQNAVTISLFTDARASQEEAGNQQDLRGYWGDSELPDGESLGSKLWLLQREKSPVTSSAKPVILPKKHCNGWLKKTIC